MDRGSRSKAQAASRGPLGKRERILEVATEQFGRGGYEETKWADVAAAVGIGPTALYHYFGSKQHCLFVIIERAVEATRLRFATIVARDAGFVETLVAVLYDVYALEEHDVLRNRVLTAEIGLLANPRESRREEEARQAARQRIRTLELAWGTFLARGMEQGVVPEQDVRLLTSAVLGLHTSVWQWYRPGGPRSLPEVADLYVARTLGMLGLPPQADLTPELNLV
jgi:AcrR family transcriptional regulator